MTIVLIVGMGLVVVTILQMLNIALPTGLLTLLLSPLFIVVISCSTVLVATVELIKYHKRPRPKPLTFFLDEKADPASSNETEEEQATIE